MTCCMDKTCWMISVNICAQIAAEGLASTLGAMALTRLSALLLPHSGHFNASSIAKAVYCGQVQVARQCSLLHTPLYIKGANQTVAHICQSTEHRKLPA